MTLNLPFQITGLIFIACTIVMHIKSSQSTDSRSNDDNFDKNTNPEESQTEWVTFIKNRSIDSPFDELQSLSPVNNSQPMNKFSIGKL